MSWASPWRRFSRMRRSRKGCLPAETAILTRLWNLLRKISEDIVQEGDVRSRRDNPSSSPTVEERRRRVGADRFERQDYLYAWAPALRAREQTDQGSDRPASRVPLMIEGERVRWQQVFLNLMMNAVEAMAAIPPSHRHAQHLHTRTSHEGSCRGVHNKPRTRRCRQRSSNLVSQPFFTTKKHGLGLEAFDLLDDRSIPSRPTPSLQRQGLGGVTAIVSLPLTIFYLAAAS